ncbi:MAG: helix-turn-helix transcriptional regulator [Oscillospiraceae bacterium]|nr:helix-turn-helix transcriptional regulator [Oscillospiraceae bacterium]
MTKIIGMYSVYHEMDITNFIHTMEEFYKAAEDDSNLKRIWENRGLTQPELAEQSGINVRNIQMYEQRVNDIDKAQSQTLYKLSRVLGCDIEDLLENPMMYLYLCTCFGGCILCMLKRRRMTFFHTASPQRAPPVGLITNKTSRFCKRLVNGCGDGI